MADKGVSADIAPTTSESKVLSDAPISGKTYAAALIYLIDSMHPNLDK